MLTSLVELAERMALRTSPQRAVEWLGLIPTPALEAMRRARFRRTLQIVAERSPFYREQFRRRGIDVRRIDHPSQLGDFYTTGEDLRSHGADAFLVRRADTAFETTGTTSPVPKRVFFSRREIADMGRLSAIWLHLLGLRAERSRRQRLRLLVLGVALRVAVGARHARLLSRRGRKDRRGRVLRSREAVPTDGHLRRAVVDRALVGDCERPEVRGR